MSKHQPSIFLTQKDYDELLDVDPEAEPAPGPTGFKPVGRTAYPKRKYKHDRVERSDKHKEHKDERTQKLKRKEVF